MEIDKCPKCGGEVEVIGRSIEFWGGMNCRAKSPAQLSHNPGSPKLPPEIVESFYQFCVEGGWNKETYDMLDAVFTFCTRRQLRANA